MKENHNFLLCPNCLPSLWGCWCITTGYCFPSLCFLTLLFFIAPVLFWNKTHFLTLFLSISQTMTLSTNLTSCWACYPFPTPGVTQIMAIPLLNASKQPIKNMIWTSLHFRTYNNYFLTQTLRLVVIITQNYTQPIFYPERKINPITLKNNPECLWYFHNLCNH